MNKFYEPGHQEIAKMTNNMGQEGQSSNLSKRPLLLSSAVKGERLPEIVFSGTMFCLLAISGTNGRYDICEAKLNSH
jgi:hypothetical protein